MVEVTEESNDPPVDLNATDEIDNEQGTIII